MARLVPAVPKGNGSRRQLSEALEGELDDDFVVFQPSKANPAALVCHPDLGCVALVVDGEGHWDPDAESWLTANGDEIDVACGTGATPLPPTVAARTRDPEAVAEAVIDHAPDREIGERAITDLIRAKNPDATEYTRGAVTEAQRKWRDKADSPIPVEGETSERDRETDENGAAEERESGDSHPEPGETKPDEKEAASDEATHGPSESAEGAVKANAVRKPDGADEVTMTFLRSTIETALGGRDIYVGGVKVTVDEVADPEFLLPAVLVAANEAWMPLAARRGGVGGFHVRVKRDEKALLGYSVDGLEHASRFLMFLPVARVITAQISDRREEAHVDRVVQTFVRWLAAHGYDTTVTSQYDARVVERKLLS